VTNVTWDAWQPSWGDYHHGSGAGSYVCNDAGTFACGGVRLTFDRPVGVRRFYAPPPPGDVTRVYAFETGAASGFAVAGAAADPAAAWSQPATLTGVSADGLTVTLNVTFIGPTGTPLGGTVYYGWGGDYPTAMPLEDPVSGLPVAPFNATVPFPPRPASGNCTYLPDTDGSSSGVVAAGNSPAECCVACYADRLCVSAAFAPSSPGNCFLKYGAGTIPKPGTTLCVLKA
jgi:hypothetical protein